MDFRLYNSDSKPDTRGNLVVAGLLGQVPELCALPDAGIINEASIFCILSI